MNGWLFQELERLFPTEIGEDLPDGGLGLGVEIRRKVVMAGVDSVVKAAGSRVSTLW